MIPELGSFALALACGFAMLLMVLPIVGIQTHRAALLQTARPLAYALFAVILVAALCLVYGLVTNDFSVRYIAQNSNSTLPVYYRIAAAWGAHEGSLLLWSFLLACWTLAVALSRRKIDEQATSCVLAVMGFVNAGFLLFIVFTSNPFARTFPLYPIEGQDLNPLLQDIGLIFHPPLLYMGYVGFSVAFAFAIAALIRGRFDQQWMRWARPWVLVAWVFLTLGILLGSVWAYLELGWGGWWFWDPVENASLMPWLTGTALVHSMAVAEKRGNFKIWTLLLAITTFSLCLIGTFLVRSGILVSVHAFSSDPSRGMFILAYLVVVIGGSFLLFAMRGYRIRNQKQGIALFSKDSFIIAGNVLLLAATLVVLLGTLLPLFHKQLGLGSISIGAPFFNSMFNWLVIPFALLLGLAPVVKWQQDRPGYHGRALLAGFILSLLAALALSLVGHEVFFWGHFIGMFLMSWITLFTLYGLVHRLRASQGSWGTRLRAINAGYWGMLLAHLGMAMLIFGISFSHHYQVERNVRMNVGDSIEISGYQFVFKELLPLKGPNYRGTIGVFNVMQGGHLSTVLLAEKRIYDSTRMSMTEAAVNTTLTRDLYVALGEPLSETAWSARLYYKPFACWIWLGGLCMGIGGLLAVFDRRYRMTAGAAT
jgi:cytochrome c-type biogenesis protein CcmF